MFLANKIVSGIQAALQDSSDGKIFSSGKRKYDESKRYMVKHIDYGLVLVYLAFLQRFLAVDRTVVVMTIITFRVSYKLFCWLCTLFHLKVVVVVDDIVDSHIQRIVLATEETTVTQLVSHRPVKC